MQISDRIKSIKPSLTLAMNAKALELKEQGVMVTSLAVGEPDFPTPKHICEAAKAAIDSNFCRYTAVPGIMELRKAVCGYYSNQYDLTIGPENVIISNGGKQALYNYIMCTVNPGDEVIIPAPYWVSYPAIVELAGGVPVYVEAGPEDGFKVTPDKIRKAITPKTKLFILNSPCNPTGAVYSAEELKGIMDVVIGAGLNVFSDEVYDQLVFAPAEMASASPYFAKYPEQVSILCGLSKSFAMTGWRVGFLVAHKDIIKKCSTLQGQSTSNPCGPDRSHGLRAGDARSLQPPPQHGPVHHRYVEIRGLPASRRCVLSFHRRAQVLWREGARFPGTLQVSAGKAAHRHHARRGFRQ